MTNTLKLRDAEPYLPGLALPEAFQSLEQRLESTVQLCKMKCSVEGQLLSFVTVCQETQRLLKFAFIENGMLASRIEIFTRYHTESMKKMEAKLAEAELENKVTRKQIKNLRKRISANETLQRKKSQQWWDIKVNSTDYESFNVLSRSSGAPDLEFMLRVNQVLIDFVSDQDRSELFLPPMGNDERAELSKLASIYKLRCRYGKSTQLAPSTLIKARQTCIPGHGEVDAILDSFARSQNLKRQTAEEGQDTKEKKDTTTAPPNLPLPSTMLTPLSSLASPTIDVGTTPVASPPTSGLNTPTATAAEALMKLRRESGDAYHHPHHEKTKSRASSLSSDSQLSRQDSSSSLRSGVGAVVGTGGSKPIRSPRLSHSKSPSAVGGVLSGAGSLLSLQRGTAQHQQQEQLQQQQKTGSSNPRPAPLIISGAAQSAQSSGTTGHAQRSLPPLSSSTLPTSTARSSLSPLPTSPIFIQHHGQIRPMGHPTVVASPLKVPLSQLPVSMQSSLGGASSVGSNTSSGGRGEGGKKESPGGASSLSTSGASTSVATPPTKRIRLTRKSAGSIMED